MYMNFVLYSRNRVLFLSNILYHRKNTITMVNIASTILWYIMTIFLTTTWSFPDSSIGKKFILARTSNGYELVPDGSKLPGIPVSSVKIPNSKPQVSFQVSFVKIVGKVKL